MDKKTGGPAFPPSNPGYAHGMTLRDYFAAKAMQVELAQCKDFPDENWRYGIAADAYSMADAMLKARET